jgi:hypothetical protein
VTRILHLFIFPRQLLKSKTSILVLPLGFALLGYRIIMQNTGISSQSNLPEDSNLQAIHHPAQDQHPHLHLQQDHVHADAEVTGMLCTSFDNWS